MGDFLTSGRLIDATAPYQNVRTAIAEALHDLRAGVGAAIGMMTGPEILAALLPVDGTGSGLDADKLDGRHATDFLLAADAYVHPATHPPAIILQDADNRFFTDTERTKLAGIEAGANLYIHPATHPPSVVEQDADNRFFTDTERTKLAGIATGANQYIHPAAHPPSIITQDPSNRFVTDAEKASWNSKAAGSHTHSGLDIVSQVASAAQADNALLLGGVGRTHYQNASNLDAGTLPAGRFSDEAHGHRLGGDLHQLATPEQNGFMAAVQAADLQTLVTAAFPGGSPNDASWGAATWGTSLWPGINAATLEGQVASFFRDASNINAGTLNIARLPTSGYNASWLTAGTLPAGRIDDTAHGNRGGHALHALATPSANGFMSSTDYNTLYGGRIAPAGSIFAYAGSTAPAGFLLCQGQQDLSTTTYARLFAVIGYTYGGSGSSFGLPDLRSRVPMGAGQGSGLSNRTLGATGGAETHVLLESEMPSHTHSYVRDANGTYNGVNADLASGASGSNAIVPTGSAGSNAAHNNVQPFLVLNFIIAY